ncbi:MAG: haloacid dehalogenase type II [Pseudomonadota bacterium]
MRVEAALFDVFGTCVDWRSGVAAHVAPLLAERGVDVVPEHFADLWRAEYQPAMARVRAGARPYTQLDDLHLENLDRVLERLGLGARFETTARAHLNTAWERLPAWPDVAPGLEALRDAGVLVAPCSNGSIGLMARLARFAGLDWDAILGADVARTYKPEPAAYLASAASLRLPPERIAFVAAHNDDLAAAQALGFVTAFVARPHEHGLSQTSDLAPSGAWDVVAEDFTGLKPMFAQRPS